VSTTVADIVTRALALSVQNAGVLDVTQSADVQTALVRVSQAQTRAWTEFTQQNKTAFLTSATVISTSGNGNRSVDLSTLSLPVQRIVRVTRVSDGTEVALVDPMVPETEMAPRYYTQGEVLKEVSNDWDTAASGTVNLTVQYASRPADLTTTLGAAITQAVSIPDRYCDYLVYDLGGYLAYTDVGREGTEAGTLWSLRDKVLADWITSAAQFGGVQTYTFSVPVPGPASKA